jgi:hypothetical protein
VHYIMYIRIVSFRYLLFSYYLLFSQGAEPVRGVSCVRFFLGVYGVITVIGVGLIVIILKDSVIILLMSLLS